MNESEYCADEFTDADLNALADAGIGISLEQRNASSNRRIGPASPTRGQ